LSLQNVVGEALDQHEIHKAWEEIERPENDRAGAIMAGALVENSLRRAIQRRSNFHSMIETGFARGLYKGLVRNDLHVVRRIRNVFAHSIRPISFDTSEVIEEVNKIQYVKWVQLTGGLPFGPARQDNEYREIYTNVCRALMNDLFMIAISGGMKLDFSASERRYVTGPLKFSSSLPK
jgi:hypothetical protein